NARNQRRTGRLATFAGSPQAMPSALGCRHDRDRCREAGACRGIVVSGVTRTRPSVKPASLVIVLHGNTQTREIEASRRVRLTLTRPALEALARTHMSR